MGACTSALKRRRGQRKASIETITVENRPLFNGECQCDSAWPCYASTSNSLIQFYCPQKSLPVLTTHPVSSPSMELASTPFVSAMPRPRGSIPRPVVPGLEHARAAALAVRSRSISPASTITLQSTPGDLTEKSSPLPNKIDLNPLRDRYRAHKRLHFFTRQTQPLKSAATTDVSTRSSVPGEDSAYASLMTPSNNTQRQRAISLLSSSSALSDVFNQDALFDDEHCSLKSVALLCDQDETLTLDSISRNEQTCSSSSNSLSIDTQPKTQRTAIEESLDELPELTTQRKSSLRSMSIKTPSKSEDIDYFTIDIESYRQVMKDVMVVKTLLHQLDRLLKQSDSNSLTDSMIGSFHESMISSRRLSSSTIDDHGTYDDLVKEVTLLRKEREQDKQAIKLLQEQLCKYSSENTS